MPTFSTWSEWQVVSEQSHATFQAQWQVFYQGLPLLSKTFAEAPPTAWYDFYFAHIDAASPGQLQVVAEDLRVWRGNLAARLTDLSGQLWRSPEEKLRRLAQWLAEFDLFLPLQAKACGLAFDSFRDWLTQLSELENFTADADLKNAVREVRWQGFVAPLAATTAAPASVQTLDWHWQEILRLLTWQQSLFAAALAYQPKADFSGLLAEKLPPSEAVGDSIVTVLAQALAQLEQRLLGQRQQLQQVWLAQSPEVQAAWAKQAATLSLTMAQGQLAKRYQQAEVLAIFALRQQDKHLAWLAEAFALEQYLGGTTPTPALAAGAEKTATKEAEKAKKALLRDKKNWRHHRQQLHNEWQEMALRFALHQRFGQGFVDGLSLLVLLATFGLLLLFVLSAALPPLWVVIVDTALCSLLLLDFFLRWSFAPDRKAYFRRHWLLGFLPALPFGLLLYSLEALLHSGQNPALEVLRALLVALRQLRPLIQLLRLLLLFFRTLDDLVRRYAFWLNRDIVFLATAPKTPPQLRHEREPPSWSLIWSIGLMF
jgi:hypothetical protein